MDQLVGQVDSFNIDGLDIDLKTYFETSHINFASHMKCISLDSKYLYELDDQFSVPDFTPLLDKLKKVETITVVKLPLKQMAVVSDDGGSRILGGGHKGYKSLIEKLLQTCKVESLFCPFVVNDGSLFVLVANTVVEKSKSPIDVVFPNLFEGVNVTVGELKTNGAQSVSLFVPEGIKGPLASFKGGKLDVKKVDTKRNQAGAPPTNALNIYTSCGQSMNQKTGGQLYFDSTPSTNLYWQGDYKYMDYSKIWARLDELGCSMFGRPPNPKVSVANGVLYDVENPVTIAILDTGILASHRAFQDKRYGEQLRNRIIATENFVDDNDPSVSEQTVSKTYLRRSLYSQSYDESDHWLDRNGHGTHCASIATGGSFEANFPSNARVAAGDGVLSSGIAPFAKIVMCKIVTAEGVSKPQWMTRALDWITDMERQNKFKVDIISLSVGYDKANLELRRAMLNANIRNKVIVCAGSNDGRKRTTNISFPGRFGDVICIGSHGKDGEKSSNSPIGREIDFLAPGEDIWAASASCQSDVMAFSGTSAAAPYAAGLCALILLAAQRIPDERTPTGAPNKELRRKISNITVMREILRAMSTKQGHHDEGNGYGNLDPGKVFFHKESYFKEIVESVLDDDSM